MTGVDLLLVNTPLAPAGARPGPPGALYPPLATLVLGSYLAEHGRDVALLDPTVELGTDVDFGSVEAVLQVTALDIIERQPRVVGITTMGAVEGSFAVALSKVLAEELPGVPIIVGGSWATGAAEAILDRWPTIDAVALGAAELAVEAALEAGLGRDGSDVACLDDVPGWAVRDADGRPRRTGPATHIEPAASSPLDLSLLSRAERYDTMVYLTSRGCPFRCAFCTEPYMAQGPFDEPIAKVEADLAAFDASLDVSYLWLCDPLFGASRRRLDDVLPALSRSPTNFLFESRVDTLAPESVPNIRAAGGDLVYLGLEAVSTQSLLRIDKVTSEGGAARYRERALALIESCAAHDVAPVVGLLEPVPGARSRDLEETLRFVDSLNEVAAAAAERAGTEIRPFFHAFPYRVDPGTEAASRLAADDGRAGTTCTGQDWALLCEREVLDASSEVDRDDAARFREAIRGANRGGPVVMGRALRSMPRPFLADDWGDMDWDGVVT